MQGYRISPARQRGITVIEVLGALAVGMALLVGLARMIDGSLEDARGAQTAAYQARVAAAAGQFIEKYYADLAALPPDQVTAYPITGLGVLAPTGIKATNPYQQTPCVLIRPRVRTVNGIDATVIDALVVSEGAGGRRIPDRNLPYTAGMSGPAAGYILAAQPATAQSTSGSWHLDAGTAPRLADFQGASCSGTPFGAGSLVSALFFDGPGRQSGDYLYRNHVPGMDQLNQMNTPILMNAVVKEGDPCGAGGMAAIAVDAQRNLMQCKSNGWRRISVWKEPVATYAALAALPANEVQDGDVRLTADTSRAFAYSAAQSKWVALSFDEKGDLNVPRHVLARDGGVYTKFMVASLYTVSGTVEMTQKWEPGARCHTPFWDTSSNSIQYINPIGSMVLGGGPGRYVPMICRGNDENDAHYVYFDGTLHTPEWQ